MGEIADMVLNGFLDEETGEYIDGEEPGFPRRMSDPDMWTPTTNHPPNELRRQRERARQKAKRRRARRKAAAAKAVTAETAPCTPT